MLTIQRFQVNPFQENCYILSDKTHDAVIIDCGAYFDSEKKAIMDYVEEKRLRLRHLLMTHGHFDHVLGNGFIDKVYDLRAECHSADEDIYMRMPSMLADLIGVDEDIVVAPIYSFVSEGDNIRFGTHSLSIIHTPGHTPGGIEFYCEEEKCLFSGDSLFCGSIGRTDFPESNTNDLLTALKEKIMTLPDDTVVYPGHGPQTTIGRERQTNPFLR